MVSLPLSGYDEIKKLIPQRRPMVMFNSLMEADVLHAVSELFISEDNIFCNGSVLTVAGIIENIAQTAAAHNGFAAIQNGQPVPIGYIAAVKNLKIYRLPSVGEKLQTEIVIKKVIMDFVIAEGIVRTSDVEIAGCEMRIFISGKDKKGS
jgi:predicted hotdog family 3-hydroxylacyl-ACP dehydratase